MAETLPPTAEGVKECAERLRAGKLVAFPTETVYGLGANALDEPAVRDIFACKGRPLSDPLIVHVASVDDALGCIDIDGVTREAFVALASEFWPGGLTLVAPARAHLPTCLGAGTGSVGVRVPSHPLALELLREAKVPVAAPSANRFGHVSPTMAAHVAADLGESDITILNGDNDERYTDWTCKHGVESTVCKLDAAAGELVVYRRGAVSEGEIVRALTAANLQKQFAVRIVCKHIPMPGQGPITDTVAAPPSGPLKRKMSDDWDTEPKSNGAKSTNGSSAGGAEEGGDESGSGGGGGGSGGGGGDRQRQRVEASEQSVENSEESEVGQEAPGQLITHYAPDVPTFMIRRAADPTTGDAGVDVLGGDAAGGDAVAGGTVAARQAALHESVVLDYGGYLIAYADQALAYRDLSPKGDTQEAARGLFAALRWTEDIEGAKRVLICDVMAAAPATDEHAATVADRAFRAASGRVLLIGAEPTDLPPLS